MIKWSAVRHVADRIVIVGGGPSLRELPVACFDRARDQGVKVLAVNRSIEWLPSADYWFTLDPRPEIRRIMASMDSDVGAYAAVPPDFGTRSARIGWHKAPPEKNVRFLQRVTGDGPLGCRYGLSADRYKIHTGNSLYGALGVAFLMGARQIGLLGLDGTADGYAFGRGKPSGPFDHLPALFASAVPQLTDSGVTVINGSPNSLIDAFTRTHPVECLQQLMQE